MHRFMLLAGVAAFAAGSAHAQSFDDGEPAWFANDLASTVQLETNRERESRQVADYFDDLMAAHARAEPDDARAAAAKRALAKDNELRDAAVRRLDCRTNGCVIELEPRGAAREPAGLAGFMAAADRWASVSQPCGYTIAATPFDADADGALRIVTICEAAAAR